MLVEFKYAGADFIVGKRGCGSALAARGSKLYLFFLNRNDKQKRCPCKFGSND